MRVVLLLIGLCIAHLGVTLFLQTELGSDPFNVFVQGLFRSVPWPAWAAMTHGRVHLLVSLLILLVLLAVDRSYVGVGTVLCMALGGPIIDVYTLWLAPVIHGGLPLLWRLVLLAGVATLNAAFFPAGDVLLLFVIAGLVLFFTRNWGDGAILAAAVVFLLQPVEWYHCIAGLLNPAHRLPDLGVGEMYARVAEYTKAGNFGDFILGNVTLGQKASLLWAVNAGRFVQTAGLFLLGFYIGRKQLFVATEKNLRFWVKTLIVSAIAFAPLYTLRELVMDNGAVVGQTAGTALDMWQKLAFTLVLVASFILLYQRRKFSAAVAGLRFYGRMSLTNYLSQSVIGAFVYFPFGLYLAPRCGYTASLLVGILVFLLQVRFCKWWLGRHKQGPLEYIWHKWTWIGTDK